MRQIQLPFYVKLTMILLSIVLIIFLLYVGQSVLIPLFFAIFISLVLYPMAKFMETKWHLGRGIASLISVTVFVIALAGVIYFITFQLMLFSQDIPLLQKQIDLFLLDLQGWITRRFHVDGREQIAYINNSINSLLQSTSASLGNILIELSGILFWIIIIFIYIYFILHHRRLLLNFIVGLVGEEDRMKAQNIVMETRGVANNYMMGLLIEFVVVAIANSAAFGILGIHYWLLLGVIAALLNFIPYLGIIIGCTMVLLVTMIHGSGMLAIEAAAILFILHVLDANILLPQVVGNRVKMNALITIISVLIGGAIWGIAGMFLSIPLTAILKIVFEHVEELKPWALLMGVDDTHIKK